ncbi:helix-turn-helix family protein [Vibrio cholerae]|uniref:helix-turn-helix transcriptional regulator n=1 Tax=Vibrio cholerae TaxID=666 RepID=UPI0006161624|nr:helix-turn-helix transcriptional regulator [Vibrio cholerae]AKB05630.1 helix-turn-helix family protein [Vibrio cholerae]GHW89633.1 helix-turn-helix family protein [Vibrio cholerae]GHY93234.1 helix-turn-helix family protein [Vibrio cholerae]
MREISALDVLSRLAKALGTSSDSELAQELGVAKQTISTWKKRNKVPLEQIVEISVEHNLSVDDILFGDKLSYAKRKLNDTIQDNLARVADTRLAEEVLERIDDELLLSERGLNAETLGEIFVAMGAVKRLLKGQLFDPKLHQCELEDGINYFLSLHYEIAHLARRNTSRLEDSDLD